MNTFPKASAWLSCATNDVLIIDAGNGLHEVPFSEFMAVSLDADALWPEVAEKWAKALRVLAERLEHLHDNASYFDEPEEVLA